MSGSLVVVESDLRLRLVVELWAVREGRPEQGFGLTSSVVCTGAHSTPYSMSIFCTEDW